MSHSVLSSITSWTIRILLAVILVVTIGLLALSTLGGTSDSHRRGLEQAFSDSLNADVQIAQIDEFNILPQLVMKARGIHGVFRDSKNEFMADNLQIAFGFWDLIVGHRLIEDFQLDGLRFSADSDYNFSIEHAGIKSGDAAAFIANGQFRNQDYDFTLPLQQEKTARPGYYFASENEFTGHYGMLDIKGKVVPASGKDVKLIDGIEISANGHLLAKGFGKREKNELKISLECVEIKEIPAPAAKELSYLRQVPFIILSESCPK